MDIFNLYATNENAEKEGKEFVMGSGPSQAVFLIARSGNDRFNRMMAKEYEAHRYTLDQKATQEERDAAEACAQGIQIRVMSKSVLLGWRGNVKYQGRDLPFSVDNAALLLGLKDFQAWVSGHSNKFQNYLLVSEDEDAKNSTTTSSGTLRGEVASSTSEASSAT